MSRNNEINYWNRSYLVSVVTTEIIQDYIENVIKKKKCRNFLNISRDRLLSRPFTYLLDYPLRHHIRTGNLIVHGVETLSSFELFRKLNFFSVGGLVFTLRFRKPWNGTAPLCTLTPCSNTVPLSITTTCLPLPEKLYRRRIREPQNYNTPVEHTQCVP